MVAILELVGISPFAWILVNQSTSDAQPFVSSIEISLQIVIITTTEQMEKIFTFLWNPYHYS